MYYIYFLTITNKRGGQHNIIGNFEKKKCIGGSFFHIVTNHDDSDSSNPAIALFFLLMFRIV